MRGILWRVIAAPSFAAFSASATMPAQPGGSVRLKPGLGDHRPGQALTRRTLPTPPSGGRRGVLLDISI